MIFYYFWIVEKEVGNKTQTRNGLQPGMIILWCIKIFYRWYYNIKILKNNIFNSHNWTTPDLTNIPKKKTKRLSPYSESEIWEKDELHFIIKYETSKRNKAILALLWDLNARNHEITLIRIKNIRIKEKYGEEVPYEAKTGSGPILLTLSFPYVRDWLNEHLFSNEPDARLICNTENGKPCFQVQYMIQCIY